MGEIVERDDDVRAIKDLIYRYNLKLDAKDYDGYAACFVADGIFRGAHADWVVHRDLDKFVAAARSRRTGTAPNSRHFVTNILVEVDGDTAHSRCHLMVTVAPENDRPFISITGEYEDFLVKVEGEWFFRERRVWVDGREREWPPLGEPPVAGDKPYERAAAAKG